MLIYSLSTIYIYKIKIHLYNTSSYHIHLLISLIIFVEELHHMNQARAIQDYQKMINDINDKYNSMMGKIREWQTELDNLQSHQPAKSKQWVEGKKKELTDKINKGMSDAQKWLDDKLSAAQKWIDGVKKEAQDWLITQAQKKIESLM